MTTTNIYILELQDNKYYIGKSQDPLERFAQHVAGEGSVWTRRYKPLSILEIIVGVSPFEEDRITKECMAKYGIENVRGGTYVSETLDASVYETLLKEIWGAQDKCLVCGKMGHFANECFRNPRRATQPLSLTQPKSLLPSINKNTCFRCGRSGHFQKDCYAKSHISGKSLQ